MNKVNLFPLADYFYKKPTIGNYFLAKLNTPFRGGKLIKVPDLNYGFMSYKQPIIKIEGRLEIFYNNPLSDEDFNDIVEYIKNKIK